MTRFRMRQRLISIGEDFTIEDEAGQAAYEVDGKVLRIRETFELKDRDGRVVATIRGKLLSIRAKMQILREGEVVATVTKAIFAPLRAKFEVDVMGGDELRIKGSILDHEYALRRGDDDVALISKKWFRITDTYGIEIAQGEDEALILSIAVALDEMAHDPDEGRG